MRILVWLVPSFFCDVYRFMHHYNRCQAQAPSAAGQPGLRMRHGCGDCT